MHVRRSIIVLFLLMFSIPVVTFGVRANREQQAEASSVTPLQTTVVERGTVEVTVTALGTVKSDQSADLSFNAPGRVRDVYVQAGDFVLAGDVLARQTDDTQQISLEQAQLARDLAILQRDQLLKRADQGQLDIAQANIDAAEAAVAAVQGAVSPDDIRAAELSYQAAHQALTDAQQARATASGGQSDAAYALLDARVGEAWFNVEIARLQLESLQTGTQGQLGAAYARLEQAQAEYDRLLAGATQSEIDRAEAQITQAELNLEQAQEALDRMQLTAPFDGFISALNIEVGAIAAPGLPAATITDIDPLRLTVQVDEIDIRQIREGMTARVSLDAIADVEFPAELEQIALVSTNDGGIVSYDVRVRLDAQDDSRVRVGMTAEAAVVVEQRENVLIIPNLYIRLDRTNGRAFVSVVNAEDQLEEVEVTLGLQGEDVSEIISGVSEGAVVGVDLAGDSIGIFGG